MLPSAFPLACENSRETPLGPGAKKDGCFSQATFLPAASKHKSPNNSMIFNRWIDASVLAVITSRKLQHVLRSYKHEAFQKANYKLDLIEQPYLDKRYSR